MVATDIEVKQSWLKRLNATPRELVGMMVHRHLETAMYLRIQMAIWKNVGQDPWQHGVELVLICGKSYGNSGDFRTEEFEPLDAWPRLRLILTDPNSLVDDVAISGVAKSFAEELRRILVKHGSESLIFPTVQKSAEQDFRAMVNGVV